MKNNEIINRWKNIIVNDILKNNTILSPFENFTNKVDLRGISFKQEKLKGFTFNNIDFSHSSFKGAWLEKNEVKQSIFIDVDFSEISDKNNIFVECLFIRCKFNKSVIGYSGSKYSKCVFTNCDFAKSIYIRPEFSECNFENCKIKNIDYNASSFESCNFEGILDNIWFRGGFPLPSDTEMYGKATPNMMKDVSFLKADLIEIIYSNNCDLSTIVIPDKGIYYKYDNWSKRLDYLLSNISKFEQNMKTEIEIFVNSYLIHAKNQEWYIINRNDLENEYGSSIAEQIIEILNSWKSSSAQSLPTLRNDK